MRLESIQVLRGIAASLVFVFHLVLTVDRYSPADMRPWVEFGNFGVDLFFVISGFVMAYSVRELGGGKDAAAFLARRFWRIAPLLYILSVIHIWFSTQWGRQFDLAQIVNCFTILPAMQSASKYQYALIPAWTLGYELLFYILVASAVVIRLPAMWAAVPILMLAFLPERGPFGSTLMIEFVYGLAAYVLWQRGKVANPLVLIAVAALLLAFPFSDARFIAWGMPAALIFLATLAWQPGDRVIDKKAKCVGEISYSLYLSHVVTFDAVAPIFSGLGPIPLGFILAGTGMLIAWLVYEAIEAPLWRLGRSNSSMVAVQN